MLQKSRGVVKEVCPEPKVKSQSASPNRHYPLTVVIATLGGESLKETIAALNRGTIVPEEILICIPKNEAHKVESIASQYANVKIISTNCKGQVAQRAVGFQKASHDIVMQLDDDLLVETDCIAHLLNTFETHGSKISVAPGLMNMATGVSTYKKPARHKLLQTIYYWVFNGRAGYQPGKIDKSGTPIGVDPKSKNEGVFEVEWLAGGCVMHYKENLILKDFYPFEGKAYYEDIIHSFYLRKAGINLMVNAQAHCWLEAELTSNCNPVEFLKQLRSDFIARKYAMRTFSQVSSRMYLFYLARYFIFLCKKAVSTAARLNYSRVRHR